MSNKPNYFQGFSRLNRSQRLTTLENACFLSSEDLAYLNQTGTEQTLEIINQLVENVIGCFQLPLGVAPHFKIDGEEYVIPMAVEETSIIAAASGTAKWLRDVGVISTETLGYHAIGQIQFPLIKNLQSFEHCINKHKSSLIADANKIVIPNFVARGGGVKDIIIRTIPRDANYSMVILHVLVHTCDAMGANIITQVCEYLKDPIQKITQEKVGLCILSNLSDTKLTRATVSISNFEPKLGDAIVEAGMFAELDPYRAATHNKGILNGIDAVLVATGNDWRAVEAGMHAYAARNGKYSPLTKWQWQGKKLLGTLEAPISVGTVGGVTSTHPTSKLCLRLLRIKSAEKLARIVAAVGLIQNLAALRALTTGGIIKGHMKLHLNNLLLAVGATQEEAVALKTSMEMFLKKNRKVTLSDVKKLQSKLRKDKR